MREHFAGGSNPGKNSGFPRGFAAAKARQIHARPYCRVVEVCFYWLGVSKQGERDAQFARFGIHCRNWVESSGGVRADGCASRCSIGRACPARGRASARHSSASRSGHSSSACRTGGSRCCSTGGFHLGSFGGCLLHVQLHRQPVTPRTRSSPSVRRGGQQLLPQLRQAGRGGRYAIRRFPHGPGRGSHRSHHQCGQRRNQRCGFPVDQSVRP